MSLVVPRHPHRADSLFPRRGWNDSSRSSTPSFRGNDTFSRGPPRDRGSRSGNVTPDRGGHGWGDPSPTYGGWPDQQRKQHTPSGGEGTWRGGNHVISERDPNVEKRLFGEPDDPSKQHTGINFEKYDDIPVEATGAGVPEPIITFADSPLDPVLLENISYARYNTPTPVQKYSVPIVAAGRDLMACAQVCSIPRLVLSPSLKIYRIRLAQVKLPASSSPSFLPPSPKGPAPLPLVQSSHTLVVPARAIPLH